jgi:hypothetical protein
VFLKGGFPQLIIKLTALFTANHHYFGGTFFVYSYVKKGTEFYSVKNM